MESLGLSDGELGTALVGLAIGLVAGTRLAGAPIDRFGSRPVMRAGFPLLAAALLLPGIAGNGLALSSERYPGHVWAHSWRA